ncbi:MAG: TM2 domain-containing protein, partial [Treponema sp.]|nr:TM2 domain-containing protein [Treponema sp.]
MSAVLCTACGRQVEELKTAAPSQPNIVINNSNNNTNVNSGFMRGSEKNKWVAVLLCIFLGWLGAHRFYEGKILSGILWACTCGLCG